MLAGIIAVVIALAHTGCSAPSVSPSPSDVPTGVPAAEFAAFKNQLRGSVEQLWTDADTDHNGRFEATDMQTIFQRFDDNGDRQVSRHEFEEHFGNRNDSALDIVADALFLEVDMDGDGEISGSDINLYYGKIDKNDDNTVEKPEFMDYFEQVLTYLYVVEYQAEVSSPIPGVGR